MFFTVCPTVSPNYRLVDGRCYYIESVQQSSYETAQAGCVGKFPKGGRLFEPQSIEINEKVMIASREIVSGPAYFYIGVKRSETVGSDYKLVSSSVPVPFAITWHPSAPSTVSSHQCVYARNGDNFYWDDQTCFLTLYAICESVAHDMDLSDIKVRT